MGKTFKDRSHPAVNTKKDRTAREYVRGGEISGREQRFQSGNAVFRRADPDNPKTMDKQLNFAVDYKDNLKVYPSAGFVKGLGGALKGYTTMNAGGKSAHALPNITVGSGTDDKGAT